jgi:hypothetical protein
MIETDDVMVVFQLVSDTVTVQMIPAIEIKNHDSH